jgi:hypothetical protein
MTQVISSMLAEKLPCMCGRATLATEVSTACIMEASIVARVIIPRLASPLLSMAS